MARLSQTLDAVAHEKAAENSQSLASCIPGRFRGQNDSANYNSLHHRGGGIPSVCVESKSEAPDPHGVHTYHSGRVNVWDNSRLHERGLVVHGILPPRPFGKLTLSQLPVFPHETHVAGSQLSVKNMRVAVCSGQGVTA